MAGATFLLSGCSPAALGLVGQSEIPAYICELVFQDLEYASDELTDVLQGGPDPFGFTALEVTFDITGDSMRIYADSASGAGEIALDELSDSADALSDAFGGEDVDEIEAALRDYNEKIKGVSEFCGS